MNERIPARVIETLDPGKPPRPLEGAIHTRSFSGRYRTLRMLGSGFLFLLFFGTAWLTWNDRQAVLWDMASRQFHIFAATFLPQDFILLSALLIICAFGLFFITVAAGRVWCGYTCPQSVWTWVFMWVEKVTEGDRNQRIKLDAGPWSWNKLRKRGAKHGLWLGISLVTGLTFVGYFTPIRGLLQNLLALRLLDAGVLWVAGFAAATYLNAGWLREKVCRDMCPYSRFQSVMFDRDTLLIAYDSARGEPRGARRKDSDPRAAGLGDCIDCTLCVQVCPTGIDIRDGLQLECIGCGACIDACDSVMDKLGYARGLVRYTSESELDGGRTHWLRPRLVGYATALLIMIALLIWALAARPLLSLDVTRDRGLFRENAEGQIENIYRLKLINKTQDPARYRLSLAASDALRLNAPAELRLAAGEILDIPVSVTRVTDRGQPATLEIGFALHDLDHPERRVDTRSTFIAPHR